MTTEIEHDCPETTTTDCGNRNRQKFLPRSLMITDRVARLLRSSISPLWNAIHHSGGNVWCSGLQRSLFPSRLIRTASSGLVVSRGARCLLLWHSIFRSTHEPRFLCARCCGASRPATCVTRESVYLPSAFEGRVYRKTGPCKGLQTLIAERWWTVLSRHIK